MSSLRMKNLMAKQDELIEEYDDSAKDLIDFYRKINKESQIPILFSTEQMEEFALLQNKIFEAETKLEKLRKIIYRLQNN